MLDLSTYQPGVAMSQSPLEAKFAAALGIGRLRIWGGDGEEGEPGGEGIDNEQQDEGARKLAEAEDKAKKAEERAKEAEKQLKDAEKKQQEKEREGMEDAERTAAERDDYKDKFEKLLKIVETTHIDAAINNLSMKRDKNGQPAYQWQDPTAVRAFIDKEGIEIDLDSGDISGLEQQLKTIAKDRPYLLVPTENPSGDKDGYKPPDERGTGSHPYGGQARQRETDRNKLGQKYRLPGFAGAGSRPM